MRTTDAVTFADLCDPTWADGELPWLDRADPGAPLGEMEEAWRRDGFVVLPGFLADFDDLLDAYMAAWWRDNGPRLAGPGADLGEAMYDIGVPYDPGFFTSPGGWDHCTPYRDHPAVADLCCARPLHRVLAQLIGEPMGVHLNLTGWTSTTRNWHQDGYLNPDYVRDFYAAAWIALDDIDPRSGPFQLVPGSHRLPVITQARMLAALDPEERTHRWPTHSERILTPIFEEMIEAEQMEVVTYTPARGDVLVWHARLLHRGSTPADPHIDRRALIAHYSGIGHRPDMPAAQRHGGGWVFPIDDRIGT